MANILFLKLREFLDDLFGRASRGQMLEHQRNGNPKPSDARLSATHLWVHRDPRQTSFHEGHVTGRSSARQDRPTSSIRFVTGGQARSTGTLPVGWQPGASEIVAVLRCTSTSGIGCFVDIDLPDDVSGSTPRDILIRDIHVEVDDCDHGAAAILVVRNGRLAMLELVAYAGEWPPHPVLRGISYLSPDGPQHHRDMIEFGRMIAAEITVRESQ